MPATFALADVVKQHRQYQQFRFADLGGYLAGQRQLLLQFSAKHPLGLLDGKKSMNINGIDVVHVVLYLAVYVLKFRNETV